MCWLESLWGSSLAGWSDSPLFSGLVGALIGGLIAGVFSILAVNRAHKHTLALEEKKQADLIQGYLQGIHDEIKTLWEIYYADMGSRLENLADGQPLLGIFPIASNYFTIYEDNASLLGQIADPDLRRMIVQTYSRARGLMDSYRLNNELYLKYEHYMFLFNQQQQNPAIGQIAAEVYNSLIRYAKGIKQYHNELKTIAFQLLGKLDPKDVVTPLIKTVASL